MSVVNIIFLIIGVGLVVGTVVYELWTTHVQLKEQKKLHERNMQKMFETAGLNYEEWRKNNPHK